MHCVGRTWNLWMLNLVVNIVTTGLRRIKLFWRWYLAVFVPDFLVACLSSRSKKRRVFRRLDVFPCSGRKGRSNTCCFGTVNTHILAPLIRNMGNWKICVCSFTLRPLYPLIGSCDTSKGRGFACSGKWTTIPRFDVFLTVHHELTVY